MDLDLVQQSNEAAITRLEQAEIVLAHEGGFDIDEEISQELYEAAARGLAGPFCGCNTCVVREVLSAAWPHLRLHAVNTFLRALSDDDFRGAILETAAKAGEQHA